MRSGDPKPDISTKASILILLRSLYYLYTVVYARKYNNLLNLNRTKNFVLIKYVFTCPILKKLLDTGHSKTFSRESKNNTNKCEEQNEFTPSSIEIVFIVYSFVMQCCLKISCNCLYQTSGTQLQNCHIVRFNSSPNINENPKSLKRKADKLRLVLEVLLSKLLKLSVYRLVTNTFKSTYNEY